VAGRAAEEIVFGDLSTGAGNDLERATDIARRMVAELGMSEKVGPVTFIRRPTTYLQVQEQMMLGGRNEYSEATAQAIDGEVRQLLVSAYDRARTILTQDRSILDELARRLLEKEVVDREELRELIGLPPEQPSDQSRPEIGHAPAEAAD
jgi:cell division protease FtsH